MLVAVSLIGDVDYSLRGAKFVYGRHEGEEDPLEPFKAPEILHPDLLQWRLYRQILHPQSHKH